MSEILLVNPRRRRASKKRVTRKRRRNPVARANPVRRRKRRVARRRNPVSRRRRTRSRRRNPLGFKQTAIKGQVTNGVTGALGALGLDVALAYIPVPAMLKAGVVGKVVKGVAAIGLGIVANRFLKVSATNATRLTEGALTVQFHGIGRELLTQFAPGVALSAYLNDEFDSSLGYAGSGWNPSLPLSWGENNNQVNAYVSPGYDEMSLNQYDSSGY